MTETLSYTIFGTKSFNTFFCTKSSIELKIMIVHDKIKKSDHLRHVNLVNIS